jgi:thiosulfate/3-mercaptopyruvate sulfurtransferase
MTLAILTMARGAAAANPPARPIVVPAQAVAALLADPQRVVIDTRGDRAAFEKLHLRGARYLDWDAWDSKLDQSYAAGDAQWTAMLSALGLRHDTKILLYDDGRMGWSALIWIALSRLGAGDIQIVSTRASIFMPTLPSALTESGPPQPVTPSHEQWTLVADHAPAVIGKADVLALIAQPAPLLFDNRSREEYDGAPSAQEDGLRSGHIPKSILLPRNLFFDDAAEPLPASRLTAIMKSYGVEPKDAFAVTCRSGGRSSSIALLLWEAGFRRVALYSGSWMQWGADRTLPAERR